MKREGGGKETPTGGMRECIPPGWPWSRPQGRRPLVAPGPKRKRLPVVVQSSSERMMVQTSVRSSVGYTTAIRLRFCSPRWNSKRRAWPPALGEGFPEPVGDARGQVESGATPDGRRDVMQDPSADLLCARAHEVPSKPAVEVDAAFHGSPSPPASRGNFAIVILNFKTTTCLAVIFAFSPLPAAGA